MHVTLLLVGLLSRCKWTFGRRQQWYYTGKLYNDLIADPIFEGSVSNIWTFDHTASATNANQESHPPSLLYGGILTNFSHFNTSLDDHLDIYLEVVMGKSVDYTVRGAWTHSLYVTRDYKNPLIFEIGLYDMSERSYVKYSNITASAGIIAVVSADQYIQASSMCRAHAILMTADTRKNLSPLQHLWIDVGHKTSADACSDVSLSFIRSLSMYGEKALLSEFKKINSKKIESAEDKAPIETSLRVMTYNLWHTNPAAWLYGNPITRWNRYWRRIRLFVDTILDEDPDVICLQEVRFDSTFSASKLEGYLDDFMNGIDLFEKQCVVSGSQAEQIRCMLDLGSARRRSAQSDSGGKKPRDDCVVSSNGEMYCSPEVSYALPEENLRVVRIYQLSFQPAMSMAQSEQPWVRGVEEGVAIYVRSNFSAERSLRVSKVDSLLLPRNLLDAGDDHQRVLLHAELELVVHGRGPAYVDIYTTHLSLSETARNESFKLISKYMNTGRGLLQLFCGDFNAEPHEGGIQELSSIGIWDGKPPLQDLWLTGNPLPSSDDDPSDKERFHRRSYTFPTCRPEKRIDYLFARNITVGNSSTDSAITILTSSTELVGQKASAETVHLVNSRAGMGMMDPDSPLWASDHMGLVTNMNILLEEYKTYGEQK